MSRYQKAVYFLAEGWIKWAALVGSVIMFRYLIMLPFLHLIGMEPLFHTGTEMLVSFVIGGIWCATGVEALKRKMKAELEPDIAEAVENLEMMSLLKQNLVEKLKDYKKAQNSSPINDKEKSEDDPNEKT